MGANLAQQLTEGLPRKATLASNSIGKEVFTGAPASPAAPTMGPLTSSRGLAGLPDLPNPSYAPIRPTSPHTAFGPPPKATSASSSIGKGTRVKQNFFRGGPRQELFLAARPPGTPILPAKFGQDPSRTLGGDRFTNRQTDRQTTAHYNKIHVLFSRLFKAKIALGGGPRTDVRGFGRNLVGVVGGTWGDAPWVKKVILTFPVKKYF